jgi:hypothetical protein
VVPPASHWISRVPWYSGYSCLTRLFAYRVLTFCDRPSHAVRLSLVNGVMLSTTPKVFLPSVWPLPRSLATTCGISFDLFSSPYLDVSVRAVSPINLCIQLMVTEYCSAGFPHSDTHGSVPAFGSPWLFADRCVLLRLLVPRHPPYALCSLTKSHISCGLYRPLSVHDIYA